MARPAYLASECFDKPYSTYTLYKNNIGIQPLTSRATEYRDGAKKMVAKGKTYGKKKARELVAIFSDLSITPSKGSSKGHLSNKYIPLFVLIFLRINYV